MSQRFQRSAKFTHLLWRRHPDPRWLHGCRPEIVASDGQQVRRLSSQVNSLALQTLTDEQAALETARKIEASVSQGVALMGYAMFEQHDAVAILHTAPGLEPGWVAFPHRRTPASLMPTLPTTISDSPTIRLACTAELKWRSGKLTLDGLLESRSDDGAAAEVNLAAHVREWSVSGRVIDGGEPRELLICRETFEVMTPTLGALQHSFVIDEPIWREYETDPSFSVWFTLRFDRELFCLPDDWLRLWAQAQIQR